jgi:hypothetical protein
MAKAMFMIIEAVIDELAERIKEERKKNEHSDGLNSVHAGRPLTAWRKVDFKLS